MAPPSPDTVVIVDPAARSTITLVTWNIHGMAPRWRIRKRAIVETLDHIRPDVVLLQECAFRLRHQASQIAAALGMRAHRAGTLGALTRGDAHARAHLMGTSAPGGSKRILELTVDGVRIFNVHMPLDAAVRGGWAGRLVGWSEGAEGVIVAGDFNEGPDGSVVRSLAAAGFIDAGPDDATFPLPAPRARIDFVLVRGLVAARKNVVSGEHASDHAGVYVELKPSASPGT